MNERKKIIEVVYYVLKKTIFEGQELTSLLRAVIYEDEGQQGEEYFEGKWHDFPGALTYYPDPSPGDFIDEERAKEIMKIIDQED